MICVCPVPFGFGKIMFGLNGYTPVVQNPDSILPMVMLLHHASENNEETWNFVITLLGYANKQGRTEGGFQGFPERFSTPIETLRN